MMSPLKMKICSCGTMVTTTGAIMVMVWRSRWRHGTCTRVAGGRSCSAMRRHQLGSYSTQTLLATRLRFKIGELAPEALLERLVGARAMRKERDLLVSAR